MTWQRRASSSFAGELVISIALTRTDHNHDPESIDPFAPAKKVYLRKPFSLARQTLYKTN